MSKEQDARRAAEALVAEERAQRQRMMAAAASGSMQALNAAGGLATPGGAANSPGMSPGGEAAAAAGLSATELYSKCVGRVGGCMAAAVERGSHGPATAGVCACNRASRDPAHACMQTAALDAPSPHLPCRYADMHERYRAERLKNRQQEIVMEELCSEVEKRAALVKEQQVGAALEGRVGGTCRG